MVDKMEKKTRGKKRPGRNTFPSPKVNKYWGEKNAQEWHGRTENTGIFFSCSF